MKFLAHRGYWLKPEEQNSTLALKRAFQHGYGIETDLRDHQGEIVISHDIPSGSNHLSLVDFLNLYKQIGSNLPLAMNIKADGLQEKILHAYQMANVDLETSFFFDMSLPDAIRSIRMNMPCYSRYSDFEPEPQFLDQSKGIWVDGFDSDCQNPEPILTFLNTNKKVALVSPELHNREHHDIWKIWKHNFPCEKIMLCTDFPEEADNFFNDPN